MTFAYRPASLAPSVVLAATLALPSAAIARNIVLFVADGLRPSSVNPVDAPTMTALRDRGVYFSNSHAVFPTVTMANAASIATGHQPGDTGIFSNSPWLGYASFSTGNFGRAPGSPTPFIENDQVLADLGDHFSGSLLGERTLLSLARGAGYSTAAIGKLGPVAIQDAAQLAPVGGQFPIPQAIFIDDATAGDGVPLPEEALAALREAHLPLVATPRLQPQGDRESPGTRNANWGQQVYFVETATRAVLPLLKHRDQPFILVYWSRDPDGTQHNQGDSFQSLWPGINGETSALAVRNADHNLQLLLEWIESDPLLAADTDVIVTSDHGFATISKRPINNTQQQTGSSAAQTSYADVAPGTLPSGFLAIDLARHLKQPLFDPDTQTRDEQGISVYKRVDLESQHPLSGNGLIGGQGRAADGSDAELVVTANGGSDSIYLPHDNPQLLKGVVNYLATLDYVGALFVHDRFGLLPGTLPLSSLNLLGSSKLPTPDIIVSFRSFELTAEQTGGTTDPLRRVVQITDSPLQQGQGNHGGLGRESTFNFMAAVGPDFRAGFIDSFPASNADIAPTLAALLNLRLNERGPLSGRALTESLRAASPEPVTSIQRCTAISAPAEDGRRTLLHYQTYNGRRYADDAEFRTLRASDHDGCTGLRTSPSRK